MNMETMSQLVQLLKKNLPMTSIIAINQQIIIILPVYALFFIISINSNQILTRVKQEKPKISFRLFSNLLLEDFQFIEFFIKYIVYIIFI